MAARNFVDQGSGRSKVRIPKVGAARSGRADVSGGQDENWPTEKLPEKGVQAVARVIPNVRTPASTVNEKYQLSRRSAGTQYGGST